MNPLDAKKKALHAVKKYASGQTAQALHAHKKSAMPAIPHNAAPAGPALGSPVAPAPVGGPSQLDPEGDGDMDLTQLPPELLAKLKALTGGQ